jgi:preprotein translocase subunit SecG
METVVLVIHLLLALSLIGSVLLQRSEGGGLGMGGGGAMSGRSGTSALGKVTWGLAAAFICTSIAMTIIAAQKAGGASVVDRIIDAPAVVEETTIPDLGEGSLLPPTAEDLVPLVPEAD